MDEKKIRAFGSFLFDPKKRELVQDGKRTQMPANICELLQLLTSSNKVVTRKEMVDTLWRQKGTTVEFEGALNTALKDLRKLLGDSVRKPTFIQRVRGEGYYFIPEVRFLDIPQTPASKELISVPEFPVSNASLAPKNPPAPQDFEEASIREAENPDPLGEAVRDSVANVAENGATPDPRGGSGDPGSIEPAPSLFEQDTRRVSKPFTKGSLLLLSAGLAITVVGLGLWLVRTTHKHVPVLAVMPVSNHTGDIASNTLAEDTTDALYTDLNRSAQGHVVVLRGPRIFDADQLNLSLDDLKRSLGVPELDYVLYSNLRNTGYSLALDAHLRSATILKPSYDRSFDTDAKSVQVTAASIIASDVLAAMLNQPNLKGHAPGYVSLAKGADEAFAEGKRLLLAEKPDQAVAKFQDVIQLDPNYHDVYPNLALGIFKMGQKGLLYQPLAAKEGDGVLDKALMRDPLSSQAHAIKGYSLWFYHWDWVAANNEFQIAVKRDPHNVEAHCWYALLLAAEGKADDASREIRDALQADPESPEALLDEGWVDYLTGKTLDAARTLASIRSDAPTYNAANERLWAIYSLQARYGEALTQLCKMSHCVTASPDTESLDSVYMQKGYPAALRKWTATQVNSRFLNPLLMAEVSAFTGDPEAAAQALLNGCRAHDGWLVFAANDPALASLRNDARLRAVYARDCKSRSSAHG